VILRDDIQQCNDNGRNMASGFAGWPVRGGRLHEALRDGRVIWDIIIRLRLLACFIPFQLFAFPACVLRALQQFTFFFFFLRMFYHPVMLPHSALPRAREFVTLCLLPGSHHSDAYRHTYHQACSYAMIIAYSPQACSALKSAVHDRF
jgi:hypothetical protein